MQRAYNKTHDIENFEFSIVEEVNNISLLKDREQYYIDLYDSYHFGYNCCQSAINLNFKDRGKFISLAYTPGEPLFDDLNDPNIARLAFLATYINGDGFLSDSKGHPLCRKDLAPLLKIEAKGVRRLLFAAKKAGYIYEKDNLIYFNRSVFFRGVNENSDRNYMKLYLMGIRSLYNKYSKTLALAIRMIPYMNIEYNILCSNPTERNIKKIKGLKFIDLAKLFNVSIHNTTRLRDQIIGKDIILSGGSEKAFNLLRCKKLSQSAKALFINPCVYYAGTHWKDVEILGCF